MKKLFFAVIAMVAMVSVSNVFANGSQSSLNFATPEDTTTTDTVAPAEEPAATEENVAPADSSADTAMQMFSDSTNVETTTTDSTNVA